MAPAGRALQASWGVERVRLWLRPGGAARGRDLHAACVGLSEETRLTLQPAVLGGGSRN